MSDIVLRKGRLSSAFWGRFRDYYLNMPGVDPSYTDGRWRQWKESPDLITYLARKEGKVAGWIVYNPAMSAIEEILVKGEEQEAGTLFRMIDELIAVQSLVSAKILSADQAKYRWMVEYGFRPTRMLTANGDAFMKMDLSTSVLFKRLKGAHPQRPIARRKEWLLKRSPHPRPMRRSRKVSGALSGSSAVCGSLLSRARLL